MKKSEPKNRYMFEFDENGSVEVSEQIMDAYNSGFIDEGYQAANVVELMGNEQE